MISGLEASSIELIQVNMHWVRGWGRGLRVWERGTLLDPGKSDMYGRGRKKGGEGRDISV